MTKSKYTRKKRACDMAGNKSNKVYCHVDKLPNAHCKCG